MEDTSDPAEGIFSAVPEPPFVHSGDSLDREPMSNAFRAHWFPNESAQVQNSDPGVVPPALTFDRPLWQDSRNEWATSGSVRNGRSGAIPNTTDGRALFADEFWNVRLAMSYRHLFENGWIGGASISTGSVSARPFDRFDDMTEGVNFSVKTPEVGHAAWVFGCNYSGKSDSLTLMPKVEYVWQPSYRFRANIGLFFPFIYQSPHERMLDLSIGIRQ